MDFPNNTLAGNKSIGFDYQFYYFFYLLLGLRHGEAVGLEVKDDIHVDFSDGRQQLIQAKHSVQTNVDGSIISLTNLDTDLWKTFSNWIKLIDAQSNAEVFLNKTDFLLVTNKTLRTNKTLNKMSDLRNGSINATQFKEFLKTLTSETKDEVIKGYINTLNKFPANLLKFFVKKLDFSLDTDDLIVAIKKKLLEKIHIPERINDVYSSLHSELRDATYNDIKAGKRVNYDFEEFTTRFGKCFQSGLSKKLPVREFEILLPLDINDQSFIKQLVDIGDISANDQDLIIQFTTQMLTLYNQLKSWEANGDLLAADTKSFDQNSILIWRNSFRSKYRAIRALIDNGSELLDLQSDISFTALDVIDEMRKQILSIDDNILSMELSNGHFYLLTEQRHLGWHYDWQNRY